MVLPWQTGPDHGAPALSGRIALDCLASEMAAKRCANDKALARNTRQKGLDILDQAMAALDANDLKALFNADVAFHAIFITPPATPH